VTGEEVSRCGRRKPKEEMALHKGATGLLTRRGRQCPEKGSGVAQWPGSAGPKSKEGLKWN
jgi:hypothetical protein